MSATEPSQNRALAAEHLSGHASRHVALSGPAPVAMSSAGISWLVARAPSPRFLAAAGSVLALVLTLFSAFESVTPRDGAILWQAFATRLGIDFASLGVVVSLVAVAKWIIPVALFHPPPVVRALSLSYAPYTVAGIAGGAFRYYARDALGVGWQVPFPWELGTNVLAGILTFTMVGFLASQYYPLLERLERSRALSVIARHAGEVAASRDFARRLDGAERRDEVGDLVRTVNHLLETVQATLDSHHEFLADTSHELRNPLLALRVNLDLARRVEDEAERRECLEAAVVQTERLSRLVADLLTLARLEAGQIIERRPVPLGRLAEGAVRDARRQYPDHTITLDCPREVEVAGDAGRLRQVLANLLDNAARHTPPGGRIVVSILLLEATAKMTVADSGVGIAPEHLDRVFERFYHAGSLDQGGLGLGLAIVKHLCEAHGGSIAVASTLGQGTRFTVSLPLSCSILHD